MSGSMTCRISRARSAPNSASRQDSTVSRRSNFLQVFCATPAYLSPIQRTETVMLNHVSIGVRDIARTKRFYDAALKPLGYIALSEGETSLGYGKDAVVLWISPTDKPVPADEKSGLHFC